MKSVMGPRLGAVTAAVVCAYVYGCANAVSTSSPSGGEDAGPSGTTTPPAGGVDAGAKDSGSTTATLDSGTTTSGQPPADSGAPQPVTDSGATTEAGPVAWTCPAGPFTGDPVPSGATPTRIASAPPIDAFNMYGFGTVEGPVWNGTTLYVSEFLASPNPPPSRILSVGTDGTTTIVFADPPDSGTNGGSGTNGMAIDRAGNLYAGVHKDGSVSRVDIASGKVTPIVSSYLGARFNSPNDLAVRSDGNIYFSDPTFQAPSPPPQAKERLYRIAPGASVATVVDENESSPNGVTLSIDEKTLYVTNSGGLFKYPLATDGTPGTGAAMTVTGGSIINGDGMAIDCAGNLYVASQTNLFVINTSGAITHTFTPAGVTGVTNAAFGGADHKTLYITGQGNPGQRGVFSVQLNFPGMPY